jgi:hypothetical protein
MSKLSKNVQPITVVLGISLVLTTSAVAANAIEAGKISDRTAASSEQSASSLEPIAQSTQQINAPSQKAEVPERSDVKSTDSTAQTLPSTPERYGCVSGYGDGEAQRSAERTYQGDRPLSRYEFAAALNACLNRVEQLIDSNTSDRATQEDLAVPKRQLETLRSDLERLRMRVDRLDGENK